MWKSLVKWLAGKGIEWAINWAKKRGWIPG